MIQIKYMTCRPNLLQLHHTQLAEIRAPQPGAADEFELNEWKHKVDGYIKNRDPVIKGVGIKIASTHKYGQTDEIRSRVLRG